MLDALIVQGIGAIGYTLLSLSYYKKEKKQILFLQIFAYIFFALHYYLLNGITGTICNLIGLFALVTMFIPWIVTNAAETVLVETKEALTECLNSTEKICKFKRIYDFRKRKNIGKKTK